MCGVVGVIGNVDTRKYLIDGLKSLDYRGYDSAGVTFLNEKNDFLTYKVVGKVDLLDKDVPSQVNTLLGIGHTRWATHGAPTLTNCHPHFSSHKLFSIVHNGVIENYRVLKTKLIELGYTFESETDTEVIANLIEYNYKKNHDVLDALRMSIEELKGSFASAIIFKNDLEGIYFIKRNSPLFIGDGEKAKFLASDAGPIIPYTTKLISLEDNSYGYLTVSSIHIYKGYDAQEIKYANIDVELMNRDLGDYPNYMLKEIEETPRVISRLIDNYFDGNKFLFNRKMLDAIKRADDIIFLACGTSYHAALLGVKNMQYLGKRSEAYIASEWAYYPVFTSKKPLYILISQSGETADLIRCQKIINARGSINIAITNTKGSTIERDATYSCLIFAGVEVAVASTKAFSAQVSLLTLLTAAIENKNNIVEHLRSLNVTLEDMIERKNEIEKISECIKDSNMIFFIGRGSDYIASLEASLKMKEISYLHCDAFPGGELKHGPIAVVDKNTSLICFDSDMSTDLPIRNNVKEIESRGAKSYVISFASLYKNGDAFSIKDAKSHLSAIPMVFFSQYLAYFVALHKGVDIDKPRNLAKSVTVE